MISMSDRCFWSAVSQGCVVACPQIFLCARHSCGIASQSDVARCITADSGVIFTNCMKTIFLLMMIVLCQFAVQHEAIAQTKEQARAQAMIESLQEQKAQSEMNLFAHAKRKARLHGEQNDESAGAASDIAVALVGVSLVLVFGYLEWSDSRQAYPYFHLKSPADENIRKNAHGVKKPSLTTSLSGDLRGTASNRLRAAAPIAARNTDCDLMRHLVCQHAKDRGTVA